MDILQIPTKGGRPILIFNWVVAHLLNKKLENEVFLVKDTEIFPMKQFALCDIGSSMSFFNLLIRTKKAKRAVQEAINSFDDEEFDLDGYWKK